MSRNMKESGVAWLGEIPSNWEISINKTVLRNVSVRNHPDAEVLSLYRDWGVVPKKSRDDNHNVTSEKTEQYKFVEPGDLVINKMKAWQGSLAVSNYEGIVSPAYYVCKFKNEKMDRKYIHHLLRSCIYAQQFECLSTGMRIGQWDLSIDDFLTSPLLIPPLEEQKKITYRIDKKCLEVDALIENLHKQIDKLKRYKLSVITEVVTKGLNPHVEMKNSGIEWIGDIPAHWNMVPIKLLKSQERNSFVDGPFGSNLKSTHYVDDGDVYVIESGFISTGTFIFKEFKTITEEHFKTINRSECRAGDIIIAKIGASYGMAAELPKLDRPSVVSGNSLKITLDQSKIVNYMFVRQMEMAKNNGGFRNIVNENAQPALSLGALNNFKLVVAPMDEQEQLTKVLIDKCGKIDSLIAIKQRKIEKLNQYKKSIIYEYVTGKKEA